MAKVILHAFGEEGIVHLSGAQTGGKIALWTEVTPPGGGPPPHYHSNEDELFLVQEGKMGFFHDDQWHEVGPGAVAFMPRNAIHTSKISGHAKPDACRDKSGGIRVVFSRCAQEFDMQHVIAISAEDGIRFLGP